MAPGLQTDFGSMLKFWRQARRFSQLDLALQADVSSKHVSFLETGRNHPSREMIMRLTQAMDVPLRDRNLFLNCAGFAPAYQESTLDQPEVGIAEEALERILDKQEPFPAIVLDRHWMLVRQNKGSVALGQTFLPGVSSVGINALELLFSKDGLQPFVVNWNELSSMLLMRVFRETLAPNSTDQSKTLFERLQSLSAAPANWRELASQISAGPTVNMILKKDDMQCSFFTTITTFGTPQDVTLQELRIESYFPSDEETRSLCEQWLST